MFSLGLMFIIVGTVLCGTGVVCLIGALRQRQRVRELLRHLGGGWMYYLTYQEGQTTVTLRLFEGDEPQSRIMDVLDLARGLGPWLGPDGFYLRPISVLDVDVRAWEIVFWSGVEAPKVSLAAEMLLRSRLDELVNVLDQRLRAKGALDKTELEKVLHVLRVLQRERMAVETDQAGR